MDGGFDSARSNGGLCYLNWFATLVKAVSSLPPRAVMALTAATETRMAMSAYSIAVAPDSSRVKSEEQGHGVHSLHFFSAALVRGVNGPS